MQALSNPNVLTKVDSKKTNKIRQMYREKANKAILRHYKLHKWKPLPVSFH